MGNAKTLPEPVGPTCLYKGDQSEIFKGDAVAQAEKDGWLDNPTDAKAKKSPKTDNTKK